MPSSDDSYMDGNEFEAIVSLFIEKMGYGINSTERRIDGSIDFLAKTLNPVGGSITSLIRAAPYNRPVTEDDVGELLSAMKNKGAARSAFITTSDFTREAMDFALGKPVSLVGKYQLMESIERRGMSQDKRLTGMLEKHGLEDVYYLGSEHAFDLGRSRDDALDCFRRVANRKGFFGMSGSKNEVKDFEGRYVPVAVFKTSRSDFAETGDKFIRKVEVEDKVFINLSTGELYYIVKSRKGDHVGQGIESSDVLTQMLELPEPARESILNLLEHGDLPYGELEGIHLSILQKKGVIQVYESGSRTGSEGTADSLISTVDKLLDFFIYLVDEVLNSFAGLAGANPNRSMDAEKPKKSVKAKILFPHLSGGIYDIGDYLILETGLEEKFEIDKVKYRSKDISQILKRSFNRDVAIMGVLYMPYYRCSIVDDKGKHLKHEILVSPRFSSDTMAAGKKQEASVSKKYSSKFDAGPYRLVR